MMPCRWKMVRSAPLWAFIVSFVLVGRVTAETDARCRDILQQALADTNPDTRKHAVAAVSLVGAAPSATSSRWRPKRARGVVTATADATGA